MLEESIRGMAARLQALLAPYDPAMILYGSVVLDDFRAGWSDIDFILLTARPLEPSLASRLVTLRQDLLAETHNPYFRRFEGGILSREGLFAGRTEPVIYWGTSGQRLTERYELDPFARLVLRESGRPLLGEDFRADLPRPSRRELVAAVEGQYRTVRAHGHAGSDWFFTIARCLYTLRTNRVIAKTKAGEWALAEGLCPDPEILARVLALRQRPRELLGPADTQWLAGLGPAIQRFADVLATALRQ